MNYFKSKGKKVQVSATLGIGLMRQLSDLKTSKSIVKRNQLQ